MTGRLLVQGLLKLVVGFALISGLLFIPAGSLSYINGWILLAVLFIPMLIVGAFLLLKDPKRLKIRLESKESQPEQRTVIWLSALVFVVGFVLAGLGYRFGWYILPLKACIAAAVLFLLGYALYVWVLVENAYISRTIRVQCGQQVVDTGLYSVVRHPMYSMTVLMFLSMPLVLGSLYGFAALLSYPLILARRIKYEEALLERELQGYKQYKAKVRYRLIPFVW